MRYFRHNYGCGIPIDFPIVGHGAIETANGVPNRRPEPMKEGAIGIEPRHRESADSRRDLIPRLDFDQNASLSFCATGKGMTA
jgi:hypothetical protein